MKHGFHAAVAAGLPLALAAIVALGCGPSRISQGMDEEYDGAPAWVVKGCMGHPDVRDKPMLCGVGSATGTRNPSLARSAATARARTELARSLEVSVRAMVKDYQATTTGGEGFGVVASDEQHIVDVSRQVTKTSIAGTQLIDSWVSDTGTLWVIVALDSERFGAVVDGMETLPEKLRKTIVSRAETEFRELNRVTTDAP